MSLNNVEHPIREFDFIHNICQNISHTRYFFWRFKYESIPSRNCEWKDRQWNHHWEFLVCDTCTYPYRNINLLAVKIVLDFLEVLAHYQPIDIAAVFNHFNSLLYLDSCCSQWFSILLSYWKSQFFLRFDQFISKLEHIFLSFKEINMFSMLEGFFRRIHRFLDFLLSRLCHMVYDMHCCWVTNFIHLSSLWHL